jgi:ribosomal protein S18 acetylase RimI-like enzyme
MSPAKVQIRPAAVADLDAVFTLERATENAPHWPPETYAQILARTASPVRCLFVAQLTPQHPILGFAVGLARPGEPVAELESVAVAAHARRLGIGYDLCTAVLDWCAARGASSITLEVRAVSVAALALYDKLKFGPIGRRPGYYPDDDALVLRRDLAPPKNPVNPLVPPKTP